MASRAQFRLCIITDRHAAHDGDIERVCEAALRGAREAAPAGAVAIQLREKGLCARDRFQHAIALREICSRYGAPFLINDRADIALAARADGIHLPFDSIGVTQARELVGDGAIVGFSAHSPPDVAMAARAGADYVTFAPVFAPLSKAESGKSWGVAGLGAACRAADIPVFALGGITAERIDEIYSASVRPAGFAVIGSIFSARDPAEATKVILSRTERAMARA